MIVRLLEKIGYDVGNPKGNTNRKLNMADGFLSFLYAIFSLENVIPIWTQAPSAVTIMINGVVLLRLIIKNYFSQKRNIEECLTAYKDIIKNIDTYHIWKNSKVVLKAWEFRIRLFLYMALMCIFILIYYAIYLNNVQSSLHGITILIILCTLIDSILDNLTDLYEAKPYVQFLSAPIFHRRRDS